VLGRGYASFFVLGLWFMVEAVEAALRGGTLRARAGRVLRLPALWISVVAVVWAAFWLGYNVTGEMRLRDVPVTETSIYNSASRRLPFFGGEVASDVSYAEGGLTAWGEFAVGQVQRVVLWSVPGKLAGDMHWSFGPGDGDVEVSAVRLAAFFGMLAVVVVYIARLPNPQRGTAFIAAFAGTIWTFFMINLTARHIYVTMYSLGFTLMLYTALATWAGRLTRRGWAAYVALALSLVVFAGANWQMRQIRANDPRSQIEYTDDFQRIQQSLPTETGVVYPAYGNFKPWCIFQNNQCYVLGYYLSEYRLTTAYEVADYVLAPRPYHLEPPFVSADEPLTFMTALNPENALAYAMDKGAGVTRSPAEVGSGPTAQFGGRLTLHSWSLVGDVTLPPCGRVTVEGWWQADPAPAQNLNVQIVMVGPEGGAVTEANAPLGQVPTQLWEPGQFTLDARPLTVPCDTPPGEYPLILGIYDPETLAPLPVTGADGSEMGNQMYLTTLFVE